MIVCFGEALVDLVGGPDKSGPTARPGGAPANVAVAAARLGAPAAFCGRISTDRFGPLLLDHLRTSGVSLELVERGPEPTAIAHVQYDPTPVFRFEGEATADAFLGAVDLDRLDIATDEPLVLHSGSLAMFRGSAADTILACFAARSGAALRSLDPNVRPFAIADRSAWLARLDGWLGATELLRSSEEDLRWIDPSTPPLDTVRRLLERGPAVAVVTRGGAGATVVSPAVSVEVEAAPVEVVDTVGAGDAFTGALLTWLHGHLVSDRAALLDLSAEDWFDAADFATRVAGVTCTRPGADPPWVEELGP
jgi:fructokinase